MTNFEDVLESTVVIETHYAIELLPAEVYLSVRHHESSIYLEILEFYEILPQVPASLSPQITDRIFLV